MDEDSALKIGNYSFSGKNLIVIGLIIVGAFFAWVLFHRNSASTTTVATTTDTSGGASSGDTSALGGLQASIESLQQTEAAQNAQLTGIAANANSAARDASGARTDASVALNGVNQLLSRGNNSVTPAPKPAPAPGKPPAKTTTVAASQTKTVGTPAPTKNTVTTKPPVSGKGSSFGSDAWHITAAGLGLN